ncbi:MAG: hypothetical protein RRY53_08000 [Pseudoflavonifractor sp.]
MTLTCDKSRWYEDNDGFWLAVRTKDRAAAAKLTAEMDGKLWDVTAEPHKTRRSLDANSYFWVLAGKLGAALGISPDDLYRHYIPDVADNYVIIPVRDDMLTQWDKIWCGGHAGRMTREIGPCRNVKGYTNVRCFMGSSDYDTKQMARLIDLIVADCKEQGVETMTPQQLDALKERW